MKKTVFFLFSILFIFGFFSGCVFNKNKEDIKTAKLKYGESLSLEEKQNIILEDKIDLVKDLINKEELIMQVKNLDKMTGVNSGGDNGDMSMEQLDEEWRKLQRIGKENILMKEIMDNKLSKKLKDFQQVHPEFLEIFITGKNGFNVAQTNVTSDYYQADEEWWTKTYNNGNGLIFKGEPEYDDSASKVVAGVFLPIMEGDIAVGVVKALIDFHSL